MRRKLGSLADNAGLHLPDKCQAQVSPTATPGALALHNNFKNAVDSLKRDLVRTIHYLTVINDKSIHRVLGFKSIYEYGHQVAGFNENQTRSFLKIGRRMQELPELKRAVRSGLLSWTKAEKIAHSATPDNEREWIDLAQSMSARELGKLAKPGGNPVLDMKVVAPPRVTPSSRDDLTPSHSKPGPVPGPKPATEKCHVTFVFTAEEYSQWEALLGQGRKGRSKEEMLLEGLAMLSGGHEPPMALGHRHLIIIHQCPTCQQAVLQNSRGSFQVDKPLLECAKCDATIQHEDGSRKAVVAPRLRRRVLARDHHRCRFPGCMHTGFLQVHHRVPRAQGGETNLENLVTLCSRCHRRLHAEEAELKRDGRGPVV